MSTKSLLYQKKLNNFFDFTEVQQPTHQSIELLKKSKKLILDTEKYLDYSSFYNKLTMKHTFKLPEISNYPIQTNHAIIPINRYKRRIKNSVFNRKLVLSDKINESFSKKIKNSFIKNFPLDDNNNSINSKSFLTYIDKFNDMNGVIHKYITYKENYFVNRNKDGNRKLLEEYMNKNIYGDVKSNPFEEPVFKKENIFMVKKSEVKLRCDSIILYFYEDDKKKISKIKFPFECIPFFYGIDFESFILFLFSVINYDFKNEIFKLNELKFKQLYHNYLNEKKLYYNDCFLLNNSNNTHFEYDWIVKGENIIKKYKLKIQMPKIKVRFKYPNNIKTTLIKSLNSTKMSYLFLENFKDWDLFLLNSFFIMKEFRKIINQALSYNLLLNNKNIKHNLDDPKIKLSHKNYSKYSSVFFITFHNESTYKNLYFEINTPKIKINYNTEGLNPYEKIYQLNIKEAIQLNRMRKSFWPEDMINRCLIINENIKQKKIETSLELDQKIFEFDNDLLKFIKRQDNFLNEIIKNKSTLKITIIFPNIIWYDSIELIKKKYNLSRQEFEQLFELPIMNWYKFIFDNITKIQNSQNNRIVNFRNVEKKNTVISSSVRSLKRIRQKSLRNVSKVYSKYKEILNGE